MSPSISRKCASISILGRESRRRITSLNNCRGAADNIAVPSVSIYRSSLDVIVSGCLDRIILELLAAHGRRGLQYKEGEKKKEIVMSVAYQRWEIGAAASSSVRGYKKITTGSPQAMHQYGSEGVALLRRQQQQQQQQHPHDPCRPRESGTEEQQRCNSRGMMIGGTHSMKPGAATRPLLNGIQQASRGLSLTLMKPKKEGTSAEECSSSPLHKPESTTRVVQLPETVPDEQRQCANFKVEPSAPPSPSSSSSSSICDRRDLLQQSSCSSEDTTSAGDLEAQSAFGGPLHQMSALESSLPIKYVVQ